MVDSARWKFPQSSVSLAFTPRLPEQILATNPLKAHCRPSKGQALHSKRLSKGQALSKKGQALHSKGHSKGQALHSKGQALSKKGHSKKGHSKKGQAQ